MTEMYIWLTLVLFLLGLRAVLGKLRTKRDQGRYLLISGIAVALIMGLRYPAYAVVYDLGSYVRFYEVIGRTPWSEIFALSRFEYGYVVLNKLLATVVPWPQFIVIAVAAICVFCVARFIYVHSERAFSAMLYYVTLGSMTFALTAFRQAIAIGICLLSIELLRERKTLGFVLSVLFAATFHKTAIVFLLAYFLIGRKVTFTNGVLSVGLTIAAVFGAGAVTVFGNRLFEMEYGSYVGNPLGGAIPIAIYMLIVLISVWQRRRLRSLSGLNLTIAGLAIYVMRYATLALERISFFFTVGAVIALPEATNAEEDPRLRAVLEILSASAAIALFAYRLTTSEWGAYRFFWQ